jgi:hypothetical protein
MGGKLMKRLIVVAASVAVFVVAGATGAVAGEVKGPPGVVDNTNETGLWTTRTRHVRRVA